MATIKVKRSAVAGRIPATTDLELGEIAINTYDGVAYIKKNVSGTETVVSLGGNVELSQNLQNRYQYTATANQTTFAAVYLAPYVDVYLNGVRLLIGVEFTATNGTSIVLASGASAGNVVDIVAYTSYTANANFADLNSTHVTTALGFTPYNATNPSNFITQAQARGAISASGSLSYNSSTGVISYTTPTTSGITEGTNLYFTDARARAALSAGTGLTYNSTTGVITNSITQYTDALARAAISVTGAGSYNSTTGVITVTGGVTSVAGRTGAVTLTNADVGLGSVEDKSSATIRGEITSSNVTTALGFTPYNATNPSSYITTAGARSAISATGSLSYNSTTGVLSYTAPTAVSAFTNDSGYLTANQSISVTGDATGSGATAISLTLANSGVTAGTYTKTTVDAKGRVTSGSTLSASDIPALDASKITTGVFDAARLPSYVDDVLEYANLAGFPASGETGKIYVALDTNKTYRWSGSAYVYITSGAVDSVAGKTGVVTLTNADVGLGSVENKSSATIRGEITSTNVTSALGFTPYNATNPAGYITGITSGMVTTALGFTPYNATNPSGYITSSALSGYLTSASAASTYLPLAGGTLTGVTNLYAGSMGNSPALCFGSETGGSKKAIYLETYWLVIQGHQNEGIKLRTTDATGTTTDRFVVTTTGATINGNTALHAGNYNSYSPTLTGTGASGTWGINVTGNANSASTLNSGATINGTAYFRKNQTAGDYTTASLWTESYGNTSTGIAFHISGVAGRYLEMRNNSADLFWQSAAILNAGNYSSYAMPSGSSATNSVDVRAPIFYDSNNTGYYVDPASTSRLSILEVGTGPGGSNAGNLYIKGNNQWRWIAGYAPDYGVGNGFGLYNDTQGEYYTSVSTSGNWWFGSNNHNSSYRVSINGTGYATGDFRAPIFYDSNDTGFYADFNSTNVAVNAAGAVRGSYFVASNYLSTGYTQYKGYDNNNHFIVIRGYVGGNTSSPSITGGHGTTFVEYAEANDSTGWFFRTSATGNYDIISRITRSYSHFNSSVRSPIFYDSDDTGYYIDPASTGDAALRIRGGALHGPNPTWGAYLLVGGDGRQNYTDSSYASVCATNGNLHIDAASGLNTYINWYDGTDLIVGAGNSSSTRFQVYGSSNYSLASGSMRAPIFYDSDNTSYYVDANSGSQLNVVSLGYGSKLHLVSLTDGNHYLRYVSAGFSGVTIDGPQLAGHQGGELATNMGGDNWSLRWNSSGDTFSRASSRAPIFYDSNDTAYYCDPSDSSRLNGTVTVAGGHGDSSIRVLLNANENGANTGEARLQMWCSEPGNSWDWGGFGYNVDHNNNTNPPAYYFGRPNTSFGQAYMRMSPAGNWYFYNTNTGGTRYETMVLTNSGTVEISNSVRSAIFYDLNNTAYFADLNSTGESIRAAGNITAYYSDMRLKTHLGKIENAREKVRQLEGFYYEANELAQSFGYKPKREVGVSAQAVQVVLPEIVTDAPINSKYLTIDYERLTPLLIEAVKEQDDEITDLKSQLIKQQSEIDTLKALVEKLLAK